VRLRVPLLNFSFLVAAMPPVASGQPAPAVPASRTFDFEYVARIPASGSEGGKLRVWIPVPESDRLQSISRLRIESPTGYVLHRDPEYKNQYAYLELTEAQSKAPLEVRLRFRVLRRENKVKLATSLSPVNQEKLPPEVMRFLQPDKLVPLQGQMSALAKQETEGLTQPLEKARAIYDYVVRTMKYDKSGEGWGRGDAIYACTVRKGNCTDFHALLIGMMRAAGIPARFEIGFPLPADKIEGAIGGYHCWAQFYLPGAGWVPVDASEAWKQPALREYFFGAHDPHRVLFTRGRDIRFNPAQEGEPLNYFIYPYAERNGKPLKDIGWEFRFRDAR